MGAVWYLNLLGLGLRGPSRLGVGVALLPRGRRSVPEDQGLSRDAVVEIHDVRHGGLEMTRGVVATANEAAVAVPALPRLADVHDLHEHLVDRAKSFEAGHEIGLGRGALDRRGHDADPLTGGGHVHVGPEERHVDIGPTVNL